jgi:hypothetical protein
MLRSSCEVRRAVYDVLALGANALMNTRTPRGGLRTSNNHAYRSLEYLLPGTRGIALDVRKCARSCSVLERSASYYVPGYLRLILPTNGGHLTWRFHRLER